MAASRQPVQAPDRQPEISSTPRATWPRPVKKPARFVIKIGSAIPC